MSARAIATRLRMPSPSSAGYRSANSCMWTISSRRRASASASFIERPLCLRKGSETFSTQVIESKSVECWKTIAHFFRTGYIASSPFFEISSPSSQNLALVRRQQADQVLDQDALADARGADDEEHLAVVDVEGHVRQNRLRAERLGDVPERDHRGDSSRAPSSMGERRAATQAWLAWRLSRPHAREARPMSSTRGSIVSSTPRNSASSSSVEC